MVIQAALLRPASTPTDVAPNKVARRPSNPLRWAAAVAVATVLSCLIAPPQPTSLSLPGTIDRADRLPGAARALLPCRITCRDPIRTAPHNLQGTCATSADTRTLEPSREDPWCATPRPSSIWSATP